jgi:hypothetical protein
MGEVLNPVWVKLAAGRMRRDHGLNLKLLTNFVFG